MSPDTKTQLHNLKKRVKELEHVVAIIRLEVAGLRSRPVMYPCAPRRINPEVLYWGSSYRGED